MSDVEREFGAKDFHTISTDTHIGDLVITPGGANENAAGTVHFEALLDQGLFIAGGDAVRDHPGGTAAGGRSGGGIFYVVEQHARMQAGFGVDGLAGNKVEELSSAAGQVFGGTILIDVERLKRLKRAQRGDGEGHSGGDGLDWSLVEVSGGESGETRHGLAVVDDAEFGIFLRHFAEGGKAGLVLETHRNGADVQFEKDLAGAGLPAQNKGRAERRVTGEGQLLLHGKDANARAARVLGGEFWAAESPGRMKVVSERLVSRAMACICSVVRPRPSRTTARALPVRARSVKTSTWTEESFRVAIMDETLDEILTATIPGPWVVDTRFMAE